MEPRISYMLHLIFKTACQNAFGSTAVGIPGSGGCTPGHHITADRYYSVSRIWLRVTSGLNQNAYNLPEQLFSQGIVEIKYLKNITKIQYDNDIAVTLIHINSYHLLFLTFIIVMIFIINIYNYCYHQ